MEFGYARVSTKEQNEARQVESLTNAGIPKDSIYIDKQSGKDFDRPEYLLLTKVLREGDTLFIQSIDRLGRNYSEILKQWEYLTKERLVDIVVLDMPLLDTRKNKDLMGTFVSDLVLQILSFVAENERVKIKQRQAEGIALKRRLTGRCGGRKRTDPSRMNVAVDMYLRMHTVKEITSITGVSSATLYRYLSENDIRRK